MSTMGYGLPLDNSVYCFRRFNRFYTRFIGTLQEKLLDSELSLTEARVLYELATGEVSTASEIASSLGLDPGYLSRIVARFEKDGLLKRTASREDARRQTLQLTRKGHLLFRDLDQRSNQQTQSMLEALPAESRKVLLSSMGKIEALLGATAGSPSSYTLRVHRPGDMGMIVSREGALYAQEYGWNQRFEALAARVVADFIDNFDPACERCWIAERAGEHLGHIFLVKHPERPGVAKLRLLLVEPSARGMGLGHALVAECVRFAREAGYQKITLWTQSILTAAHRIYQQAGFRLVHDEPHHSFGKDLVAQTWELDLR
ncbi:MAG TPA: helix-turn-helix domain-containing GNAT family N-acetyltransferase [Acidobacteriaceae bacterium]